MFPGLRSASVRVLALVASLVCCFAVTAVPAAASTERKTVPSESAAESEKLQKSAEDSFVATWAGIIGASAESGDEVYVAPGLEEFWDKRQQELVDPAVKRAQDAGYRVVLLVIPSAAEKDRAGNRIDDFEMDRIWQQIFGTVAEEHDLDSVVFVSWSPSPTRADSTVYQDGRLITEVGGVHQPVDLNDDVPGPWFRYSLRRLVSPGVSSPDKVEQSPDPWFGSTRPEDIVRIDQAATHWAIPIGAAAGSLIAFPLALGWAWWGAWRRKKSDARRSSDAVLEGVRKAGKEGETLVRRRVETAVSPKASQSKLAFHDQLRAAAEVLPAAAESENPVIWVA